MPKAGEVAQELRRIADALDKEPEIEIKQAFLSYWCHDKQTFLNTARLMPRPFVKSIASEDTKYPDLRLTREHPAVRVICNVPQSLTCTLIEPAKPAVYDCEPILSQQEEESLA